MCNLNHLLKSDLHILHHRRWSHKPSLYEYGLKNNVLKMHGTENSHFVCSEEFQAFRYDLLPTFSSFWDTSFLQFPPPSILLRHVTSRATVFWKSPYFIFENMELTFESFIIILTFKIHKIFFEIRNNSWLRHQAWLSIYVPLLLGDAWVHIPPLKTPGGSTEASHRICAKSHPFTHSPWGLFGQS